jgi:hypothetical protein
MPDLRRSWHGASHSFRESMRSLGSGSLGRSSYREHSASRNGTLGKDNSNKSGSKKSLGDSLRRSTGNLRDSMRSRSQSFRDTLRNSFRRRGGDSQAQDSGGKIEASPTPSPATTPNRANGTTTTV